MTIEQMIFSGASQEDIDVEIRKIAKRREEALIQKRMEEEKRLEEENRKRALKREEQEKEQEKALDALLFATINYLKTLGVNVDDEDVISFKSKFYNMVKSIEKDPQIQMMIAIARLKGKLVKAPEPTKEEPKNCDPEDVIIKLL